LSNRAFHGDLEEEEEEEREQFLINKNLGERGGDETII
jgi:hypothetical protein